MPASQTNPPPAPPRSRFDASVEVNRPVCREHYLLRLRVPDDFPATRPGQFIQIGCRAPDAAIDETALLGAAVEWLPGRPAELHQPELRGQLAFLRRPFSLAGRGDDNGAWIEIIHRVVGVGTEWLAGLNPGDPVDLIGPLGNAFTLPESKSIGLLVGGGVGLPPMFYLAQALAAAGWTGIGFVGAMTSDLLAVNLDDSDQPQAAEFTGHGFDTVVTTNDGSAGLKGLITDGLVQRLDAMPPADRAKAVIYTCGPEPMMHAVATLAARFEIDCQVCLEQAMACGMGTCQSCVVKIEPFPGDPPPHGSEAGRPWRYRLACTDGPVFDAREVLW